MKLNAALAALPGWSAAGGADWPARGTVNLTDGLDACQAAFEVYEGGDFALGYGEIYCQTAADPTPAPPGRQTMSVFAQYAPLAPADGDLDALRHRAEREIVDLVERFAPGFADLVLEAEVLLPADIEDRIGLAGGQIFQGECFPDQMWDRRLGPATPIDGFYLCGAATHPGGSVIGLNGRNAAMAALDDSAASEPS